MKKQEDVVFRTITVSKPIKQAYPRNIIRNQKYSWYSFPFIVLFNQFKHFFNVYFFFISFSQLIKTYRVGPLISNIAPWFFVLFLTLGKEAVDDLQRYVRDKEANSEEYKKVTREGVMVVPSSTLQVGDLIVLEKNQRVPADMVILKTFEDEGQCFIRTDQLDGETDWKLRNAVASTQVQDTAHLFKRSKEMTGLPSVMESLDNVGELNHDVDEIDHNVDEVDHQMNGMDHNVDEIDHNVDEVDHQMNRMDNNVDEDAGIEGKQSNYEIENRKEELVEGIDHGPEEIDRALANNDETEKEVGQGFNEGPGTLENERTSEGDQISIDRPSVERNVEISPTNGNKSSINNKSINTDETSMNRGGFDSSSDEIHEVEVHGTGNAVGKDDQDGDVGNLENNDSLKNRKCNETGNRGEHPRSTVIKIEQGTRRSASHNTLVKADTSELFNSEIVIYADKPHKDIYNFIGRLTMNKDEGTVAEPLNLDNVIWMNTVLATQGVIGCVIYTGKETRAMMNTARPRNKFGKIEEEINYYSILLCVSSVIAACVFLFFSGISSRFDVNLVRFIIIFSSVIPISLKVTIDVARMFFYSSAIMKDPDIPGCIVRNSNIPEELGRITYLLSDKTGTLTRNEMEMRKVHVGTICYTTELNSEITEIIRKKMARKHRRSRDLGSRVFELVRALAVCHNVTPVEEDGKHSYQASSPDEIAIVQWCEAVGVLLEKRTKDNVEIRILEDTVKRYAILHVFPFTSDTKRMGVLLRDEDTDEVLFVLKGADMVMRTIVERNDWLDEEVDNMAREGLRTLVIGMKRLSTEEHEEFEAAFRQANLAINNRNEEVQRVVCSLERNLKLLGLTGVEDKLQENVNQSLENLRNAGVKIWMLTGDKVETAISISISSRLFLKRNRYEVLQVTSREDAWQQLSMVKEKMINYVIIDGSSLQIMIDNFMSEFIKFAATLDAVVCCRCTPTQKALVARNLRMLTSHRVACIGDGGNDVSMITEANVGIGIVGKEGNQASLAADFSILKFSDVTTLFFWHGRNCYKGTAKLIQFIIHRGTIISVMQGIFSAVFLFSPIALYQGFIMVGYVCVYTMCPMWCIILDRDVSKVNCFKYPELYKEMVHTKILSARSFASWNLISFYQGSVIMIATFFMFKHELLSIVSITFSCLVINELLVVLLMVSSINRWMILSQVVSLVAYVLSFIFLRDELRLPPDIKYFMGSIALISLIAIAFSVAERLYFKYLRPPSYSKIQSANFG
ncbi:P-type ATPase (P-ATPase) Superfamily [Trachipleistophora hominis]|uniref:Phospholipid-transporting ATPase n=1 Tax=Trachipleistophora hominis TaxID=72359 RepID=L7JTW7_TRAHO|nr:P-type ATPase (P-ATPase) Superfamily [Trachipleistophora hominis]